MDIGHYKTLVWCVLVPNLRPWSLSWALNIYCKLLFILLFMMEWSWKLIHTYFGLIPFLILSVYYGWYILLLITDFVQNVTCLPHTYKNVINLMLHKFIIISFVYEVIGKTITEKCVTQKSFLSKFFFYRNFLYYLRVWFTCTTSWPTQFTWDYRNHG